MRVVFVAGFLATVLDELRKCAKRHLDDGAVVWVPSLKNGDVNLTQFRGDFLHAVAQGAEEVLLCLFVFRKKEEFVLPVIQAIIEEGKARSQKLNVVIESADNLRDLAWVLSQINSFKPDSGRVVVRELRELDRWVREQHRDRIVLHPRAFNAVKKSRYEDVNLIYAAVNLLGTEYWEMRTAPPDLSHRLKGRCDAKLGELGLDLSQAITPSQAGKQGETYFVKYPGGTQQKHLLEFHLTKGTDRDERNCLRIYFFWDNDAKKVVIGWLPSHLETCSS